MERHPAGMGISLGSQGLWLLSQKPLFAGQTGCGWRSWVTAGMGAGPGGSGSPSSAQLTARPLWGLGRGAKDSPWVCAPRGTKQMPGEGSRR